MFKIAVCDDEPKMLETHEKIIKKYLEENRIIADLQIYGSSEFLFHDINEGAYFDLLFLDIEMPRKTGMDIARSVRQISRETLVIFITSHNEYAIDSFELSVFRYIPKDQVKVKLVLALKEAMILLNVQKDQVYLIHTPTQYEKIPYKAIQYIQKDGKNSIITTENGEMAPIRKSLVRVFGELNSDYFTYIDRGIIVNLYHVVKIEGLDVIIKGGIMLPISKKRVTHFKKQMSQYFGGLL